MRRVAELGSLGGREHCRSTLVEQTYEIDARHPGSDSCGRSRPVFAERPLVSKERAKPRSGSWPGGKALNDTEKANSYP
jgi:hypothetical protein